MRENYRGYIIDAHPQQLAETQKWTVNITIERHHGSHINTRPFFDGKPIFKTKAEAIDACIDFGKRIIDGQLQGSNEPPVTEQIPKTC